MKIAQFVTVSCPNCDTACEIGVDSQGKSGLSECQCGRVFWYDVRFGTIDG